MIETRGSGPAEFDAYAKSYNQAVSKAISFSYLKLDFFTRVKADYLSDILTSSFATPASADVLDVGCGVGNIHPFLQGRVRTLNGVDVSGECIKTAKEAHRWVNYKAYDGKRLPFEDATFDVVFTICVMHHVPPAQWPDFADEIRRVLRPNGFALVFEHNPYNPLTQRVVSSCEFDKDAVLLKAGMTEQMLKTAGFGDVTTRYILAIPCSGRLVRRIEGLLGKLPLGAQYITRGTARRA